MDAIVEDTLLGSDSLIYECLPCQAVQQFIEDHQRSLLRQSHKFLFSLAVLEKCMRPILGH